MERTTVDRWARVLPHRDGAELSAATLRLERVGVTPEQAGHALADLGDSLYERASATRARSELERDTVLFIELAAYLAYAQERAAAGRRSVVNELLKDSSLASVASLLGVTRQAVHKAVASRDARSWYSPVLVLNERTDDV